jgi:hypothetical protein
VLRAPFVTLFGARALSGIYRPGHEVRVVSFTRARTCQMPPARQGHDARPAQLGGQETEPVWHWSVPFDDGRSFIGLPIAVGGTVLTKPGGTQTPSAERRLDDDSCEYSRPSTRPRMVVATACSLDVLRECRHASAPSVRGGATGVAPRSETHPGSRCRSRPHLPTHSERGMVATGRAFKGGPLTIATPRLQPCGGLSAP